MPAYCPSTTPPPKWRLKVILLAERTGWSSGRLATAILFSSTSTCQRLGIEPWAYLQDVLTRLPAKPDGPLGDLLTDHWQGARQAQTVIPTAPVSESTTPSAESTS
jgi:hypothetical protein